MENTASPPQTAPFQLDTSDIITEKKRPGRPRKQELSSNSPKNGGNLVITKPKRARGRPLKNSAARPGRPRKNGGSPISPSSNKELARDWKRVARRHIDAAKKKENLADGTVDVNPHDSNSNTENSDRGTDTVATTTTSVGPKNEGRVITEELENQMKEVFVVNALWKDGGLWIPHDLAVRMHAFFAPSVHAPERGLFGDVFVQRDTAEKIREAVKGWGGCEAA